MNPTKERARVELDELKIRINKLKRFVEGERITTVSPEREDSFPKKRRFMKEI